MEFLKQTIQKTREANRAFSQISLDDDYIVKDTKPDVMKVIHAQGNVVMDETKINNQAVWMNGKIEFRILYRSDDEFHKLEVIEGAIPFQEKVLVEDVNEWSKVSVQAQIEDLNASIINSRKVAIRSVIGLHVVIEEEKEEEIACSVEEDPGYEQKQEEQEMIHLCISQKDVVRVKNEIKLPNAKPNIRNVVWRNIDIRNCESNLINDNIHIQAEAYIGVLYQSEEDDQIQWYETMLPISGDIELSEEQMGDILWVKIQPDHIELEAQSDYDGENRVLAVDLSMAVCYKLWKEEKSLVLKDIYSTQTRVEPEYSQCLLPKFLMKNVAKTRIGEQFKVEANQEKILQICAYDSAINIDHMTKNENGALFEGVLKVHILYFTTDDHLPISHIEAILPFEQLVEINQMTEKTWCDYQATVDMLQVNLLDNSEYEIKAAIKIAVIAFEEEEIQYICDGKEFEIPLDEIKNQPGMKGIVVRECEKLWDIAKENYTTIAQIMEENSLKSDKITPGMRLIIVKNITSC